jgi:hypothetical protein
MDTVAHVLDLGNDLISPQRYRARNTKYLAVKVVYFSYCKACCCKGFCILHRATFIPVALTVSVGPPQMYLSRFAIMLYSFEFLSLRFYLV